MKVLVTGSAGLIGSESVVFFNKLGFTIDGIDNNMRADFFGPSGDTRQNLDRLKSDCKNYTHINADIRERNLIDEIIKRGNYDLVIHTAAQPSHDLATNRPFDDFDINAVGTINLLEACRRHIPETVFVFLSTIKVYGDNPNRLNLIEKDTRWDFADIQYVNGIGEDFPVDHSLHSLFGSSKLAADVLTQEYGRYFGMKTGVFRGSCLTGNQHSAVEQHGFLNYLVKVALKEDNYTIFGFNGKQVRDQIHCSDVVEAIWTFSQDPDPGEVYNLGGGKRNAASIIECIEIISEQSGKRPSLSHAGPRLGDHICYYTDMKKFTTRYPQWEIRYSLEEIIDDMIRALNR